MSRSQTESISAEERKKNDAEFMQKLKQAQANQPQYITCKYLFDEAKKRSLWLFDPVVKRWFSPEEFYKLYNGYIKDDKIFQRVEIKHPVEGIMAGHKQMENLHMRVEAFAKRVIEYYFNK